MRVEAVSLFGISEVIEELRRKIFSEVDGGESQFAID